MKLKEIKIGTRLELEVINSSGEKQGYVYVSQMEDVVDPENVVIASPIYASRMIFIPKDTRLRVVFFHDKYGMLYFNGIVTGKGQKGNLSMLYIRVEGEIQQIQRRKYFRLDCFLNAGYRLLNDQSPGPESENDINREQEYKKALTKNLSGSGVCILTDEEIPVGSSVEVLIMVNPGTTVKARSTVVRSREIESARTKKFEHGLHFTEISKMHQNEIIRYIFDQQRVLLKKDVFDKKRM